MKNLAWTRVVLGMLIALVLLGCGGPRPGPALPLEVQIVAEPPFPRPGEACRLRAMVAQGGEPWVEGKLAFQWFRDGQPLLDSTGPVLAWGAIMDGDGGNYAVEVAAGGRSAMSPVLALVPADRVRTVDSAADAGPGSLREALATLGAQPRIQALEGPAASPGIEALVLDLPGDGRSVIRLESPLPPLTGRVRIIGNGTQVISGSGKFRPFFVQEGADVVLERFTIAHGLARGGRALGGGGAAPGMGGALFINGGRVQLRDMVFRNNTAQGGDSLPGGDGENGGGAGFDADSPAQGGHGANGGLLGGRGGEGSLDGGAGGLYGGGGGVGDGAGGGASRGGLWSTPVEAWITDLPGGSGGSFAGGGGFSVGPIGGGGDGGFGAGGGASGGNGPAGPFLGVAGGGGGWFGGDGGRGTLAAGGRGGGGAGLGGAIFLRRGTLFMESCQFIGNRALGGEGEERGLGKGGGLFVIPTGNGRMGLAPTLALLRAQVWRENQTQDLFEDPRYDNDDWYLATADLEIPAPGSELRVRYRRYRAMLAGKAP